MLEDLFCIAKNGKDEQFQAAMAAGCCDAKFHPQVDESAFLL
jgi:hypothetical protein